MDSKEFTKQIIKKFNKIKKLKKVAERVTLLEFIEQYENSYDELTLGAFWHSANPNDISYKEAIKYVAGTD